LFGHFGYRYEDNMGQILGIQLSGPQQPNYPNGKYLVVLKVMRIEQQTQNTVLWGQSLLFSNTYVPQNLYFGYLLAEWSNKPMTWGELSQVPPSPLQNSTDFLLFPQSPPVAPVAVTQATLLACGFDPLQGYWMVFSGNYNLYFHLFQGDWQNTVGN
jgi:hypothetical protein